MQRALWMRLLSLWFAFSLGGAVGGLIVSHYIGSCDAKLIDVDTDALTNAIQTAAPGALTGSGFVELTFEPTGIRVHSDSVFTNQGYDGTVLAVTRGSPIKIEISAKLLQKLVSH
jgi:hypothetical protein